MPGGVQSAAVMAYLAGETRYTSATANFLIHKSTVTLLAPANAEDIAERGKYLELSDKNIETILRAHITLPDDKWAIHERCNLFLTADEAKTCGMAHEIADFAPPPGARMFTI